MVQVNPEENKIIIEIEALDIEELTNIQGALIELIRSYNHEDHKYDVSQTFYWALKLLEAILPNYEQQKKGFTSVENCMEIPKSINNKQYELLKDALFMVENPEIKVRSGKNVILEALKSIEA